jgi:hypothetical protein
MRQYISHDAVSKEVFHDILIEFWVTMKLIRLINMYLNETYSKVHIAKYLSIIFLSKIK